MKGFATVFLTVVVFATFASIVVLYALGRGPSPVAVPNVVGLTVADGTQAMSNVGLEIIVKREVYSTNIDEGCIVETRPAAGKTTKAGRKIDTIVSLGARTMKVPALIGHDFRAARERIERAKLKLGKVVYKSASSTKDQVLEQQPAEGKTVGRNHAVNLVLSGGQDYGQYELSDGRKLYFRSVGITVPKGHPLQRVKVQVRALRHDFSRTFYNRVRRPGDSVKVDIYGPEGATIRVFIEDEQVFTQKL